MKTPLSPAHFIEHGQMAFPFQGCLELNQLMGMEPTTNSQAQINMDIQQQQQEKKNLFYSMCDVCNIQLNSQAQAQVHYNGRSHLKRIKQMNNGEVPLAPEPATGSLPTSTLTLSTSTTSSSTGSSCHSNTLPALVRNQSLMMQSTLDMKPFMPFHQVDTSSSVGLFPNFNTMDPVQKAVINHTFGVSIPPKKKQVISCNICQLRFNSDSQAEAHYKGSKHAKKLKAQQNTKNKPPKSSLPPPPLPPPLDSAKTITTTTSTTLTSNVTGSNSDQPEQIAVPPSTADKTLASPNSFVPVISTSSLAALTAMAVPGPCNPVLCDPTPASPHQLHKYNYRGVMKSSGSISTKPVLTAPNTAAATATQPTPESEEEEKAKKLLYCSLCKVAVNSLSQLEAHNTGSKHKTMLEARNGAGPIKAYPRPGSKLKVQATTVLKGSGLQNKTFYCEICDVHVNSEIQLKQHISSRRHKDRVAGKPMKPKYSPYNKQQRSSTVLAAKLALQKDLVKPISPAAFLSNPFCPTTVPSITLHPRPNSSIFQTAGLPGSMGSMGSFLRAAPGPIRPTTGSILFAPY
ncbi:LOW QUALITY PROTEIN: zinc finger protein 385B-like [Oncorhynchus keta]|uniref:LOW QUALITY PROTEIN: zinc finger protein 385B-like n=1 Tax=Oncorhynchus keta TaxID=8018 RepID=UPI00227C630C|nr:LOW QUALITY PROTEIN: zinc finger protein 385B-like [Oncorhynchus keta]